MLKHTFRKRDDVEGRVVIHPYGSGDAGLVLGEATEGEELAGDVVVEGSGDAEYIAKLESLRTYGEYLEESVEEVADESPDAEAEAEQQDAVEAQKDAVAETGSEGQKDANVRGDTSDEGEKTAKQKRAEKQAQAEADQQAGDMVSEGGR